MTSIGPEGFCDKLDAKLYAQLSSLQEEEKAWMGKLVKAASDFTSSASLQTPNRGYVNDLRAGLMKLQADIQTCKDKRQRNSAFTADCQDRQAAQSLAEFCRSRTAGSLAQLAALSDATIGSMGIWEEKILDLDTAAMGAQAYTNHRSLVLDAEDITVQQKIILAAARPPPPGDVWQALDRQMDAGLAAEEEGLLLLLDRASAARAHIAGTGRSINVRHASMGQATASQQQAAAHDLVITAGMQLIPAGYEERGDFLRRTLQQELNNLCARKVDHFTQLKCGVYEKVSCAAALSWLEGKILQNSAEGQASAARGAGLRDLLRDREPGHPEDFLGQWENRAHQRFVQPTPHRFHL